MAAGGSGSKAARAAAAEVAPLDAARAAAGGIGGAGSADPFVSGLRRAGLLQLLVLRFCGEQPTYGNHLIERISEATGGLVAVNPNTMYPLLRTLEGDGLIAGRWEHPERRSRRFYELTEAGAEERDRLAEDIAPRLEQLAESIDVLRRSL